MALYWIGRILIFVIYVLQFAILLRVVAFYVEALRESKVVEIAYKVSEPIYALSRKIVRAFNLQESMIDFTPLVSLILLWILSSLVNMIFIRF